MTNFINKMASVFRGTLNAIRKKAFKNPKKKKMLSVIYHNLLALMDLRRSYKSELFDYNRILSGKHFFKCRDYYYGNSEYGHSYVFKKFSRYKGKIKACIEHGVYFGNYVSQDEAVDSGLNAVITFSNIRKAHLNAVATVQAIPIGPYIHYVDPLLDEEEIESIKKENGRTLLVFPSHSIDRVEADFDFSDLINEIERVKTLLKINHVMVCLFYKDVNIGRDKYYLEKGYQVVSNGYRCDPAFLSRLKTFILLSDYTMSNDVGTNVGYCTYLGKPHYIYTQSIDYRAYTPKDMENVIKMTSRDEEVSEVKRVFNSPQDSITEEQRAISNKYWGFDLIKKPDELLMILSKLEQASKT